MSSAIQLIEMFYFEGFFSNWRTLKDIQNEFEKRGFNLSTQLINGSLGQAVKSKILTKKKISKNYNYSQRSPPESKVEEKEKKDLNVVFSEMTHKKLGERFEQEIRELNVAFTNDCGTTAAFLLRKIIEKAIIIVLNSNQKQSLLKDSNGKDRGLENLINICSQNKINNNFIIQPQTSKKILGIKFLGDVAAHNPLAIVDIEDINPQLPYWITGIKELIENMK